MSRKIVNYSTYSPYHLTARTVNREPFPISLEHTWLIFGDYLYFISKAYNVNILSFVLMPNHFHLLARFPSENFSEAMRYFMGETSRRISSLAGRTNQIYGRRFHRSIVSTERYFRHAYKYVYRNPVKAGHCSVVEDYPFSSLHPLLGKSRILFPLEEDTLLFQNDDFADALLWLNRPPKQHHDDEVRKALRRKIFELPKGKNSRLPSELEFEEF